MPLGSRGISLHDLEERGQASPCRSPARRPDLRRDSGLESTE